MRKARGGIFDTDAHRPGKATSGSALSPCHKPPRSPPAASPGNGGPTIFGGSLSPTPSAPGCPHIAAKVCSHSTVDTTMGYAAIYPEDVIAHHRAFIARRRAERPSEEYRELTLTTAGWDEFLAHFELRKVALGTCGRDHGTPCQHENACVRCPLLRVDPAQKPRLEEIHTNLVGRLAEARSRADSTKSPRSRPPWLRQRRNSQHPQTTRRADAALPPSRSTTRSTSTTSAGPSPE